jgi:hypothetical protein
VLEPHVGGGAFIEALVGLDVDVTAGDIDPTAPGLEIGARGHRGRSYVGDFLEHREKYDWVIGNPPYKGAIDQITHALTLAPRVAFLLRLAFLESRSRAPFWEAHPPAFVWVLTTRPSFLSSTTGKGRTDQYAYAWFFWDAIDTGAPRLGWL